MATDAEVLTARKNLWSAIEAMKEADAANLRAANAAKLANDAAVSARQRATEARTRLVQLAESKPAERPPEPIWATEPPKSVADGMMRDMSDADAPEKPLPKAPASGPVPNLRGRRVHTS